jgi:hypothetical protein
MLAVSRRIEPQDWIYTPFVYVVLGALNVSQAFLLHKTEPMYTASNDSV